MSISFLEQLDENILSKYRLQESASGILLTEEDKSSTCPSIPIKKKGPARAFKFEPGKDVMPFFNAKVEGLTTMCDAIIFYPVQREDHTTIFIFICELKSKDGKGAGKQMEAGWLFARFLLDKMFLATKRVKVEYRGLICSPDKRIRTQKKLIYHQLESGLKWIGHNVRGPIYLEHYCQ